MRMLVILAMLLPGLTYASEQGVWAIRDPDTGFYSARLIAITKDDEFVFNYFTDGRFRCECPGIAKPVYSSGGGRYVFKNTKEYWLPAGWEGYGLPELNGDCTINFRFSSDTVEIKTSGNCSSFCGAGGGLNAILKRISP